MGFDRKLGKLLEGCPRFRKKIKYLYLRAIFYLNRKHRYESLKSIYSVDGFFGYYDKSPWNKCGSRLLFHSIVDSNFLALNLLDLSTGNILQFGHTCTWNWQQGAMLQWIPGHNAAAFNDIVDSLLVTKIIDFTNKTGFVSEFPIQTLHPDGKQALSLNYKRLHILRSEYGYSGNVNNFETEKPLDKDGIWHFFLYEGKPILIISIEQLIQIMPRQEMQNASHKVNHVIYSPNGTRFVFVHRWVGSRGKFSRLYVAENKNGSNIRLLMDDRMVSHYCWRDEDHLLVYGRTSSNGDRYYIVNVNTGFMEILGKDVLDKFGDGHPSYSPDRRWVVTDTYPDKGRMRHLLLYDTFNDELRKIGSFFSPWKFDGPNRVDLHPRWSPCGKFISIDSAHEGTRKMYIFDVTEFVCQ